MNRTLFSLIFTGMAVTGALATVPVFTSGFEDDLTGWTIATGSETQVSTTTFAPHSGQKSARLSAHDGATPYLIRENVPAEGSATYQLSAFVRGTAGVIPGSTKIKIEFYNAKGENTTSSITIKNLDGGEGWITISITGQADPDTVEANLVFSARNAEVCLDEVTFQKVRNAPAVRIFKPERLARHSGVGSLTSFIISLDESVRNSPRCSVELHRGTQRRLLPAKVEVLSPRKLKLSAQIPRLISGVYLVNVLVNSVRSEVPIRLFVSPASRKPAYLTHQGVLLRNGTPFFPIGIYHVNHTEAEYALLAAHGFNTIQGAYTPNLEQFSASLDLALKHGLAVDVPLDASGLVLENLPQSLAKIEATSAHPAILSWKICDEPDADHKEHLRDEVAEAYFAIKDTTKLQPVELTLSQSKSFRFWTKFSDVVQIDRYPVPDRPLKEVSEVCDAAKKAMARWQNLTFVVQCGWTPDLKTQPTFAEARSMVYLALISGAKGIYWYSRQDPGWDLTVTPLWPLLKDINAEITSLADPILFGKDLNKTRCNTPQVRFVAKRRLNKVYLLVTNLSDSTQEAAFVVPSNVTVQAARLYSSGDPLPFTKHSVTVLLPKTGSATAVLDIL